MNKSLALRVPYALSVYDDQELQAVVRVITEHRTNMGIETRSFEKKVARQFGHKFAIMVNSGSSANLLAFDLLDLPEGSEVITPVLTFSTTIAPLVMKRLVPTFIDVKEGKYVIDADNIEKAIGKKTKALLIPFLLGNVPDMKKIYKIAKKYKLSLVVDSCDTFGATFDQIKTGYFPDITTTSFFGSHIITAGGNGGMIMFNEPQWYRRAKILRGWGRTSSVLNESESIIKRFGSAKIDGISYDSKFIFEEPGYNFLPNEMGAAFGNKQLKKLQKFKKTRERNFASLLEFFKKYEHYFILPIQDKRISTQWLAFPLTIQKNAPFKRLEITTYLEKNNVQTRPVFTGNILHQPGFKNIQRKTPFLNYSNANAIMERGFVIGCHHGLRKKHIDRLKNLFTTFLNKYSK